jgi:phage I-like protein
VNQPVKHIRTIIDMQQLMTASEGQLPAEIELMKVGMYKSFAYGDFEITEADLAGFVESFERGIRAKGANGEDKSLPINLRHDMYGEAAGWITGLRASKGSLFATTEWTDLGKEKLTNKRYKYISPEWYFAYEDETTGKTYRNVLAGAGLTNVPLFQKLRPLTSAEGGVILLDSPMTKDNTPTTPTSENPQSTPTEQEPVETPKPSTQAPKTAAEKKDQVVLTAAEHQAMLTRINSLESTVKKTEIEQEVGKMTASATNPGKFFPAQREAAVDLLVAAEAAGQEVATKVRAFINALPEVKVAGEQGSDENTPLTAAEKIDKLVTEYQKEHKDADYTTALNEVKKAHQELFTEHLKQ